MTSLYSGVSQVRSNLCCHTIINPAIICCAFLNVCDCIFKFRLSACEHMCIFNNLSIHVYINHELR